VTAAPFLVRLWATPAASRPAASAASTYRADRMTSLIMAAAWTPFGALLAAIPLLPAYGSTGWPAAMGLFALGTGAFAGLMTGRYPLLKLTEFILAARWRERVSFQRLLEDAADRRVLLRADCGYKFADEAGELAATAVASTISIPHISDNEIFQIVREYLSGLIEGSPLKDTFAAWAEHLAGAEAPPGASQAVIPDPEKLEHAAANELSDEISAEGLQNPIGNPALASVQDESPVDAAVDLTNQARYLQENTGPCAGCVRPPAKPKDNPAEPPDDHLDDP